MNQFSDKIVSDFLKLEEDTIHKVLMQILAREPIVQDWEKLKCIYATDEVGTLIYNKYYLEFEGKAVGMIKKQVPNQDRNKFTVEFISCDMDGFLKQINDHVHAHRCYEFNIRPIIAHQ